MTTYDAPTLDEYAAEAQARAGIAAADGAADDEWKARAYAIVERLAHERREITSDDVWAAGLEANPSSSNTALGAVFRRAAAAGLIERTDRQARTAQVRSHGSPMTVWRSLELGHRPDDLGRYELAAAVDLVDLVLEVGNPLELRGGPEAVLEAREHLGRLVAMARRARP